MGLLDRLTNDSFNGSKTVSCGVSWERNLGPGRGFEGVYRHIALPTLKWASFGFGGGSYAGSKGDTDELCALNYQQTHYVNSTFVSGVDVGCAGASCPTVGGSETYCGGSMYGMDCGPVGGTSPTILAYRWIDIDDDGKVDLVASVAQGGEGTYNLSHGNMPGAPAEPAIFGDFSHFPCPSTPYNDGDITTNKYTMCHGMYPWMVYLNKGGTFAAVPDQVLYQPSPLETTHGDSSVTGPVTGQFEGNFDLDGDGHGDVATTASTWSLFRGLRDLVANKQTRFQSPVGFGAGSGDSTISQTSITVYGVSQPVSTSGLIDLNADGLPDHWTGTSSNVSVEMNNGVSFVQAAPVSVLRPANDSLTLTTDAFGSACQNAGSFMEDCSRLDVSRTVDVDNDGRADLVQLSGHCVYGGSTLGGCVTNADCAHGTCVGGSVIPRVFYNVGGQFTSSSVKAGDVVALDHHMDVSSKILQGPGFGVNSYTWEVRSDMVDLDGDGVPEGVDFTTDGTFYISKLPHPTAPPRLLVSIDNGRGLQTSVDYLALSDTTAVTQNPATSEASPRTQWVVRTVTTVDSITTSRSTNDYKNPVYRLDDRGHFGFRGFEETTTTGPSGAKSVHRYDYSVDWRGVETQSLQFSAETPGDPSRIDLTAWEAHTLFGAALTTFHAVQSKHYICGPAQTEGACLAAAEGYSQASTTMIACRVGVCDKSALPAADSVAWMPMQTLEQMGTTAADGDRRSTSAYYVMAPPGTMDFRIRALSSMKESQVSGAFTLFAKSAQTWDATYKVPLTDEHWVDTLDSNRTIAKTAYDMATGNPTQHWKPKQNAAGGSSETFDYDARNLFVKADHSELGGYYNLSQERDYQYEYGTGTKIDTQGPNVAACSGPYPYTSPTCPSGTQYMQETQIKIDGLGRTLERWETQGQSSAGSYTLSEREIDTYDPSMLSVTTQVAYDVDVFEHPLFTKTQMELDGHGRTFRKTEFTTSVPTNAVTMYIYDYRGDLVSVDVPDPSHNDDTRTTYTYTYDSLGRPLSVRRPDSSTLPSGTDISYSGMRTTESDVVGAGGGSAGSTLTEKDVYGRVMKVDEVITGTTKATTAYLYDAADNVIEVVDPTGVIVTMNHDFLGRRTQVTRGPSKWQFTYDLNGNLESETFPGSTPTDPNFIDTTTFDDLDRPNGRTIGQRGLGSADQATFGTQYEWMLWDVGTNGVGQLGALYSYAPGASLPTTSSQYTHDLDGQEGFTYEQFAGISTARSTQRTFTLGGSLSDYYYYEYPRSGGTDGSYAKYHYDDRGLPSSIDVSTQVGGGAQTIGVQTRNVAGLVTKRHTDNSVGPMTFVESNWSYDTLGRVASQVVQEGPGPTQVARQDLAYFGNDEPSTLDQWLGATNHKQFTYGYDQRHELATVQETLLPNAFTASYSYNDAGRFLTAVESAAALPNSDVTPRNVGYHYDGADPEQVTSLVDSTTSAVKWSYTYDASGNQTLRCAGAIVGGTCTGSSSIQYTYDGNDRLRRAINFTGAMNQGGEEYFYDSHGNRYIIVKLDAAGNATETIWFVGDVEAHYDGAGNWVHSYANYSMGTPVARLDTDSTLLPKLEFQFHGLANNTLATVASDSTINASFTYAPFGEVVEASNGGGTAGVGAHRKRFNDKYQDEATGLSYYGIRYYDHVSMVWTQADPLYQFAPDAGALSSPRRARTYQFALNNPLEYMDPDGADSQPYLYSASVPEDPATVAMAVERANEHEDDDLICFGRIVWDSGSSPISNLPTADDPCRGVMCEEEDPRTESETPEEAMEGIFGPVEREEPMLSQEDQLAQDRAGKLRLAQEDINDAVRRNVPDENWKEGFDNRWLNDAAKTPPNPWGKKGGPAHQAKVAEVADDIASRGLEPVLEHRVKTPGGSKQTRYVDVVGKDAKGNVVEMHQVGKQTKGAQPVARERRALDDIDFASGMRPAFHAYN
jgi:RHS repeat-associated protein